MKHFITIAGPQSSGKTVAIDYLRKKHADWHFMEVINPYTVTGVDHPGGAFTDIGLETQIAEIELVKITAVRNLTNPVVVNETGLFHSVYMQYFSGKKYTQPFIDRYYRLYRGYNSFIIFVDTPPDVSFSRREEKYLQRIRAAGINEPKKIWQSMKKYREVIYKLYPLWLRQYEKAPFAKTRIDNHDYNIGRFLQKVEEVTKTLI